MSNEQPSFYAIIPANVRYDKSLKPNAKLLYGELTALANKTGYCWSGNKYFADLYGVTNSSVSKWIAQLKEKGYIYVKMIHKEGSKEVEQRRIYIQNKVVSEDDIGVVKKEGGYSKNVQDPLVKKCSDSITSFNNTINNTSNIKDKSAKPPSASKVKYEEDNNYYLLAKFFASQMESVNERDKVKDLQKAANDFRLLYERDGKEKNIQDLTEIKNVIIATYKNEFWKDKVRSSDKFRKQYGALYNEMKKKFPNMIKQQEIKKEPIQPAYTPLQADNNGFDGTNLSYEFMNRGIDNDTLIAYYKKQVEITGKGVFDGKREIPLKEWIEDFQMFNK